MDKEQIRLLIFLLSLVTGANTLVAVWLYRRVREHSVLWWAAGALAVCLGMVLVGFREMVPEVYTIVVANGLVLVGYVLIWLGMRSFVGKPFSLTVVVFSVLVLCGATWGLYHFSMIDASHNARVVIMSCALFFFSVGTSNSLLANTFGQMAVTLTGAAFSLNGLINGVRLVTPALVPHDVTFLGSGMITGVYLLLSILFAAALIFGQVYMVQEQQWECGDSLFCWWHRP